MRGAATAELTNDPSSTHGWAAPIRSVASVGTARLTMAANAAGIPTTASAIAVPKRRSMVVAARMPIAPPAESTTNAKPQAVAISVSELSDTAAPSAAARTTPKSRNPILSTLTNKNVGLGMASAAPIATTLRTGTSRSTLPSRPLRRRRPAITAPSAAAANAAPNTIPDSAVDRAHRRVRSVGTRTTKAARTAPKSPEERSPRRRRRPATTMAQSSAIERTGIALARLRSTGS